MDKFKKSQVLVLLVLVVLLVITPSLPSSFRPTYLYFIINFLIITLSAEAGLLSVFAKPLEDRRQSPSVTPKLAEASIEKREVLSTPCVHDVGLSEHAEKFASERVVSVTQVDNSRSNVFFIEANEDVMDEEFEADEDIGGVNGQELFAKAETFIRNFYKQLKMQREESWIYQKGF